MAIRITVVERNWFNLLEALDDGEYDEPDPDEFYPGADENGDCYWGEEEAQDENLEAVVQKELRYGQQRA